MVEWHVPEDLAQSLAVVNRDGFARVVAQREPEAIAVDASRLSFDGLRELLAIVDRRIPGWASGQGMEIGAGTAVVSSLVAEASSVEQIWAVELVPEMVRLVIPKMSAHILGAAATKVVPTHATFDHLELEDGCLDFAVEMDSLHHSPDLPVTLAETARVMRAGGHLVCFDRCHPDSVTDAECEAMLDRTYDRAFLERYHYPTDVPLTRRENGENEYREREWRAAFDGAGFDVVHLIRVETRRFLRVDLTRVVKERSGYALRGWIEQRRRVSADHVLGPKDITIMLCRRRRRP